MPDSNLIPLGQHRQAMGVVVIVLAACHSIVSGATQYTVVWAFLLCICIIHPLLSPSLVLGRLRIAIDESTVLFDRHRDVLVTLEERLRELKANRSLLTRRYLRAYQDFSITDTSSWTTYASQAKYTWKTAREYRKAVSKLKATMVIMLLEDDEGHQRIAVERVRASRRAVFGFEGVVQSPYDRV
ncbi:hypothetical protein EDD85DRAFT_1004031 [Armillaria nabsnona]|nr:hypothetical protein EDD85DRAFT_1004031 [Armillaria nabsnona]